MSEAAGAPKSTMQRFLDAVEQVGNRVPHPVIIFLILIGCVIVISFIPGVVDFMRERAKRKREVSNEKNS